MISPAGGTLLIAEPFLKDPSFARTIVLLCRHNDNEGSFGFTLNRLLDNTLDELLPDMEGFEWPVYSGGPVSPDTLHYVHLYPDLVPECVRITENIGWGGDFEELKALIKKGEISSDNIRFFLGYSGWGEEQLKGEMDQNSWLVTIATKKIIFETSADETWNAALMQLGGKYKMMIHFPTDPQLN